jgi:hypothetical protein
MQPTRMPTPELLKKTAISATFSSISAEDLRLIGSF